MTQMKFNRKYREYQPSTSSSGPPTERICKPSKCETEDDTTTPAPPNPPLSY